MLNLSNLSNINLNTHWYCVSNGVVSVCRKPWLFFRLIRALFGFESTSIKKISQIFQQTAQNYLSKASSSQLSEEETKQLRKWKGKIKELKEKIQVKGKNRKKPYVFGYSFFQKRYQHTLKDVENTLEQILSLQTKKNTLKKLELEQNEQEFNELFFSFFDATDDKRPFELKEFLEDLSVDLPISSAVNLKRILDIATEEDLVLWDVDDTLTYISNPKYSAGNLNKYRHRINDAVPSYSTRAIVDNIRAVFQKSSLVDPKLSKIIQDLQNKMVPMIALTAAIGGEFGSFGDASKARGITLNEMGIDFSKTAPIQKNTTFKEYTRQFNVQPFSGCNGVVFCGFRPKGEVIKSYLKRLTKKT